jgi:hypothetical protein
MIMLIRWGKSFQTYSQTRRQNIHRGLENLGFELRWDYDYVFESWKNKN